MDDILPKYEDFLNEGIFDLFKSHAKPRIGKSYIVSKKMPAEEQKTGSIYVFKPGEMINGITEIDDINDRIFFNKIGLDGKKTRYMVLKKDFRNSVREETEFPRKVVIENLSDVMILLKNITSEIDEGAMKQVKKKLMSVLDRKTDDELMIIVNSLKQFNIMLGN